jgi:pyruvate dehydrogenase E2 component (dihydrolipoamide acetyltransferase)
MAEFRMPSLGADMAAGTLVEWRVQPGSTVKRGDVVAVVETDKGAIEIETFQAGTFERLLVEPGQKVPVGTVLALLNGPAAAAGQTPTAPTPAEGAPAALAPAPTAGSPPAPGSSAPGARRPRVSPLARRAAADLGVDVATVEGTGPAGAVTLADVERAAAGRTAAAAAVSVPDRHAAMRAAIAAVMSRSKREVPHYYLGQEIDLHRALGWLEDENARRPVARRLLPAALLLKATALAARDVPEMNGFWLDGALRPSAAVHLGVAISLRGGGLVAPAIHDADKLGLDDLMGALRDLVGRARAGKLRSSEVADPTITVTNLGDLGVSSVFAVIYPPQVAMVGFGKVTPRPWAVDGLIGVRPIVNASLAADHRASDGHRGGLFLAAIDRHLQEPEKL